MPNKNLREQKAKKVKPLLKQSKEQTEKLVVAKKLEFFIQIADDKKDNLVVHQHDPHFKDTVHRFCQKHKLDATQSDRLIKIVEQRMNVS